MKAITRTWLIWAGLAALAAMYVALKPAKAIDYLDYFVSTRHYFAGLSPMYGPKSGLGVAGSVYRYPPVCLFALWPAAMLPFRLGAALFAAGKLIVAGGLFLAFQRRWNVPGWAALWPALLLVAPYAVQELRYGNIQFYILALCVAAFLLAERRPMAAGALLGLAAALKLWPLFFLPCVLVQRRWKLAGAMTAGGAVFSAVPALWVGPRGLAELFQQWIAQEKTFSHLSASAGELWFPGQSLHDVMRRYLGAMGYSQLVDVHYRQIAWTHLTGPAIEHLWMLLAVMITLGMFVYLARERNMDAATAVMFCLLCVLEPNIHRLIYEALLWPAAWGSVQIWHGRRGVASFWYRCAVVVAVVQPLVPGAARQRILQVYGADFFLVLLPLTAATILFARAGTKANSPLQANPSRSTLFTNSVA